MIFNSHVKSHFAHPTFEIALIKFAPCIMVFRTQSTDVQRYFRAGDFLIAESFRQDI